MKALPAPLLAVTDRHGADRPLLDTVRALRDGGVRWVWLRDRDLPAAARHDLAEALLAVLREAGGRLTVGGDADLAGVIGADGVHLPGLATSPAGEGGASAAGLGARLAEARRALGAAALVGLSAHGVPECVAAARGGADYVTLSPIHASASKPGYGPALGLDGLRAAAGAGVPVLALGGIGPGEAHACRAAGAAGVAVMGALMRAPDPAARARAFLDALR